MKLYGTPLPSFHRGWSFALIALIGLLLAACGTPTSDLPVADTAFGQIVSVDGGGQYTDILPQELETMLEDKDFFLVNVHVPYGGELPSTDAFIPFDQFSTSLDQLPADKASKIVLYCRSGSMSTASARELVRLGFTNLYNLDGGYTAWSAAGYEFIKP